MKQCRNLRAKYSKILKRDGLFSVSKVISKVYANNKKETHRLVCFFFVGTGGFEDLNATPQWSVARSVLDRFDTMMILFGEKNHVTNLAGTFRRK
jgi:hypothetical protein